MVTLHFFVGTFFCLVPNTIEQQSSSPISGPCSVDSPLVGQNDKVLLCFGTNLVPNVCCMTSVEVLIWIIISSMFPGGPLFVVLEISGQPDIIKMLNLLLLGIYDHFHFKSYISCIVADFLNTKLDWFFRFQWFFKKALFQGTKLVYSLSNSIWCCNRFYFFAENVFYIFILPLMPSYRAYRCFKLIAWTASYCDHILEFWIRWLISNMLIANVLSPFSGNIGYF